MGRRIPKTRRHKKLKFVDPCYSGSTARGKKSKPLPNEPPSREELDNDQQEVPANMRLLIDMKEKVKRKEWKIKKKKKQKDERIVVRGDFADKRQPGMSRRLKPIPTKVAQRRNETQQQFFNRLQQMADLARAEAKIEEKYDAEVVHINKKSGEAKFVPWTDEKKEPSERRKRKRLKEKEKKQKKHKLSDDDEDEKKFKKENIKFGEVALQPPALSVQPKRAVQTKAGARDLFLSKLLQRPDESGNKSNLSNFSQKRKLLLPGQRRMLEEERLKAVELYRAMKKANKPST